MMNKETYEAIAAKTGMRCAICGCELTMPYVVRYATVEDRALWNYFAVCEYHRKKMKTMTIEQYRKHVVDFVYRIKTGQHGPLYKQAIEYGLLKETNEKVIFYFEKGLNK